jgi:3-hydroxyacyl-[acyl-carrier-protein] dehydratase
MAQKQCPLPAAGSDVSAFTRTGAASRCPDAVSRPERVLNAGRQRFFSDRGIILANSLNTLDIQEIMALLPHRYPFLLIDRVLDYVPGESLTAVKNVTINEPIFTGHFPNLPIFPGVLILEAMAQATGLLGFKTVSERKENELYLFAGVDEARFKKPVVPGDQLILEVKFLVEKRNIWKFYAEAKVDGQIVCSAQIMCARREL